MNSMKETSTKSSAKDKGTMSSKEITPIRKVDDPTDAFLLFIENWDSNDLQQVKSAKAVFLDSSGKAYEMYDIPVRKRVSLNSPERLEFSVEDLLEVAKNKDARSVIIAENALRNGVEIDETRYQHFMDIKRIAKSVGNIKIKDLMSIHSRGYSSFKLELV